MTTATATSNKNLFWDSVEKTESGYVPGDPIIINGKLLTNKAENFRNEMFRSCTTIERFAAECFMTPPKRVLDLGAGIGANTRPMAKRGAHVTAIDSSKELLQIFANQCVADGCPKENIRLRHGDITIMKSYGENFKLVVAVDILSYITPKDLHLTMEKIQKCLADKGILIGTIFTTDTDPTMRIFMGKMGAHFYEGGKKFTEQLLTKSGFSVEKLEAREEGGFRFKAVKVSTEEESS
ncbi:MAG: tRNA (cmo5U34)-methyltransferase [Candidatus Anoxychlamydiales bacterium]|nr:tRNA (cmo5U34)-methyltransferase [Candidatus Anoxychlamydiales bacterium]